MSEPRFEDLLRKVIDGESHDVAAIEEAMEKDESLLAEYLDQVELDAMLEWEFGSEDAGQAELIPIHQPKRKIVGTFAKAAAFILPVALAFYLGIQKGQHTQPSSTPAAVAVLIDSEDCVWEKKPAAQRSFGASFAAGETLRIRSGIARFAMWGKAGVAIVGPAEIELVSREEISVRYGSVSAFAPDEAIGFKVTTPDVEIVDLGTHFGASVAQDGTTDVHVFEGEISVQSKGSEEAGELITTGQARRYTSVGDSKSVISIDPERFAEPPALEQLLAIATPNAAPRKSDSAKSKLDAPGILAAQRFTGAEAELSAPQNGSGFADQPWWAKPVFTSPIPRVESHSGGASAGGFLLVRGRDKAEPFVANRLHRKLDTELPRTFYFALRANYRGHDDDDFFALWIDSNAREGASHAEGPSLGIREGRYFARVDVAHAASAGEVVDSEEFTIAGRYIWNAEENRSEIALWVNPQDPQSQPDAVCDGPVTKKLPRDFRFLGLRIGQYTEVSDRLSVHGLATGTSLESVLTAVHP